MVKDLDNFYRSLLARGFSAQTVRTRRQCLKQLAAFLLTRDVDDFAKVTLADLEAYLVHLFETVNKYGRVNGAGYRNNHVAALKTFFPWLQAQGRIVQDPSALLDFIKMPRTIPRMVPSIAEMRKLLAQPDKSTVLGYRDRSILELMYAAGPRHAEVLNLKVNDLNLDDGIFQILNGKGGKDRVVPLTAVATRLLRHYLKDVRPQLLRAGGDAEYLFLTVRGKKLDQHFLGEKLERYLRTAGIKKRFTPHSLRHACATHLLQRNANIRHIQELLGHESLQSTQIYTSVAITDLKRVISSHHPRNTDRLSVRL